MNIQEQMLSFTVFIIIGVVIGILFDVFRILRKSFKTPDIITYVHDFMFWMLTGILLIYAIHSFNNGNIRIYIFVALVIGLLLYLVNISKYFIYINVKLIDIIKSILILPFKIIYNFIKKIFFNLKEKYTYFGKKMSKFFGNIKKKTQLDKKSKKNIQ